VALRITVGLVSAAIFLTGCLYSFWTALIVAGVANIIAQHEFCRIVPRVPARDCWIFVGWSTAVFLAAALCLAGHLHGAWLAAILAFIALYYALVAIVTYERDGEAWEQWTLLRSLLLVTLPLAFLPAVACDSSRFPFFFLLMGASWGADTGAIFAGKALGRRKLAPRISPNKTVEGALGGMISAGAVWALAGAIYPLPPAWTAVFPGWQAPVWIILLFIAGAVVAVPGVAGDLTFSLFKRQAGIKDYGRILPGHGGILDRFDSLFFIAPLIYLLSLGA